MPSGDGRRGLDPIGAFRSPGPRVVAGALLVALLAGACGASGSPSPAASGGVAGAVSSGRPAATGAGPGSTGTSAASAGTGGGAAASSGTFTGGPATSAAPAPSSASPGDAAAAAAVQSRFVQVIRQVNPSVVLIETPQGLGSGVVFDANGDVVTNAHVAAGSSTFRVTTSAGRTLPGTLVGTFAPNDLAVIRVKGGNLPPATFGDSSKLAVGDIVMAMGNPLGLQSSVTQGIVSALGRTVSEPNGAALPNVIQTSAPINPGNSGGALVDLDGDVVGIPTLAASDPQMGGAASGIGFAIPSNIARDIAGQIVQYGRVVNSHRAYLGIQSADLNGGGGILVYTVRSGGPAAAAGIRAGDIITAIGGRPVASAADLAAALAGMQPGRRVSVQLVRQDGSHATVNVALGQLPGQ